MLYTEIQNCRGCGKTDLVTVLDMKEQYIVDFPLVEAPNEGDTAPLLLVKCTYCHLVQLKHSVNSDRLFKKFWYRSGINESMKAALKDVVVKAVNISGIKAGETVLDIGCNDGTMLSYYPASITTVGIDPAADMLKAGLKNKFVNVAIEGYFSAKAVKAFAPFKVITAIAMFYDLENPGLFLKECAEVLAKDGVLVIQMNYLRTMLENSTFDNVNHEHLCYFSMSSLMPLIEQAGLEIVGAEMNDVNGGSFRVFVTHAGAQLESKMSADDLAKLHFTKLNAEYAEMRCGLMTQEPYSAFQSNCELIRDLLSEYIVSRSQRGKQVYVYGASTRGTALLQYLHIGAARCIRGAAERDSSKYKRKMVGSWIPIYPEERCRGQADVFLVLPWHFFESIRRREERWLLKGGEFILPLPYPRIITSEMERNLLTEGVTVQ